MSVFSYFSSIENNWLDNIFTRYSSGQNSRNNTGQVYLIGAGPGDPELITVKAQRILNSADVVLYDWLVADELITSLPASCKRVFVGKRAGKHSMTQPQICQQLVKFAQQGLTVVRLKGGDPSIFARICEEAEALQQAAIKFAIIPGVTTACATSAYTGIPLTKRHVAASITFMTAQFSDPKKQPDWQKYRYMPNGDNSTLVVYMGLNRLEQLVSGLISVGWPKNTPIALIEQATTLEQRINTSTLDKAYKIPSSEAIHGPTLIIIGEVINHTMPISPELLNVTAYGV